MKVLPDLQQQLKKNNQGASLVTVLVIIAIVFVIVTVLLTMTLYNFYMKKENVQSRDTQYSAEQAMEEIRLGLITEVSKATSVAYGDTLEKYGQLPEEEKEKNFKKCYKEELQKVLLKQQGQIWYDLTLVESYLRETKWDGTKGATLMTEDGRENALNVETDGLVLKNVAISFRDEKGNVTEIVSDISLDYPPINFSNTSAMDNILCYGLIADQGYVQREAGETKITGNAFFGQQDMVVEHGTLSLKGKEDTTGYFVSAGGLKAAQGANIILEEAEQWIKDIELSSSASMNAENTTLYVQDDIVLNQNASATLQGELYAYGNPEAMKQTKSHEATEIEDNYGDYSSAILLNGKNAKLDVSRLQQMMISSVAYINTSVSSYATDASNSTGIATGQSVMTKGDQRAYLIPPELVGADYFDGGANPITAKQYDSLMESIKTEKNYESIDQIVVEDFIDFQKAIPGVGYSLETLGAEIGYDRSAIQVPGVGTMYYFFIKFKTQEDRNAYVTKYYQKIANYNRLQDNVAYYAGNKIEMPLGVKDVYHFYFQGNLLASNQGRLLVSDSLTSAANTEKEKDNRLQQEILYADQYSGLIHMLKKDYEKLTETQKQTSLYENIINTSKISGTHYFVSEDGMGAVVTDKEYVISDDTDYANLRNVKDIHDVTHPDGKMTLVISKKDVVVERDFEGLIISGGTITVKGGCDITENAGKVAVVLNSQNQDGKTAADAIKNASAYMVGGIGNTQQDTGVISLPKQVTFKNWKKR